MRIVLNARAAQYEGSGVPTYARNLLAGLSRAGSDHDYLILLNRDRPLAGLELPPSAKLLYTTVAYESHLVRDVWEQFVLPWRLQQEGAGLYHHLDFTLPGWAPCPMTTTIHDMIAFTDLDERPALALARVRLLIRLACRRAARVITLSHHSRLDIERITGIPSERISVVYLGAGNPASVYHDDRVDCALVNRCGSRFLLNAGSYQSRKNRVRLVAAFAKLAAGFPDLKLVLTGQVNRLATPVMTLIQQAGLFDRVVLTGNVSLETMDVLTRKAELAVLPSLYEGFGLPVLEAMVRGVPVICSAGGALAEIAGGAALAVDPTSVEDLAAAMRAVLEDRLQRARLAECGRERAAGFSWEKTAQDTLLAYQAAGG